MSSSRYLPPFTNDERAAMDPHRPASGTPGETAVAADPEATYADFLGEQVED